VSWIVSLSFFHTSKKKLPSQKQTKNQVQNPIKSLISIPRNTYMVDPCKSQYKKQNIRTNFQIKKDLKKKFKEIGIGQNAVSPKTLVYQISY